MANKRWLRTTGFALCSAAPLLLRQCGDFAYAAPPPDADPAQAPWFESLRAPNGSSCCSIADCRATDYRQVGGGYEAWVDDQWMKVPPERVLDHIANPTGRAVVCYAPGLGILCFVRPAET